MRWSNVQANWPAFYEAITEKWPDADEDELDEIDGDQRAFIRYIAELTGQKPTRPATRSANGWPERSPPMWSWTRSTTTIRFRFPRNMSARARMNMTTMPDLATMARSRATAT